jgi:hypothetical protein
MRPCVNCLSRSAHRERRLRIADCGLRIYLWHFGIEWREKRLRVPKYRELESEIPNQIRNPKFDIRRCPSPNYSLRNLGVFGASAVNRFGKSSPQRRKERRDSAES